MADIEFRCPRCDGSLVADENGAGRRMLCSHCSRRIFVPTPARTPGAGPGEHPLRMSKKTPSPAPTTNAVHGAPGAYRVWVKCPSCTLQRMHIKCFNCGSEDKFWIQTGWALCYCGSRTVLIRCPECRTRIRWQYFRALVEPIHAHQGLSVTLAVVGEEG